MKLKTLLVERNIDCPFCMEHLKKGDIMYIDEYRAETICGHCKEEYEENVLLEEGEHGEKLK